MARPLSLSSRASSAAAPAVDRLLLPGLRLLQRAPATRRLPLLRLVATARRSGDSAVVKGECFSKFLRSFAPADEVFQLDWADLLSVWQHLQSFKPVLLAVSVVETGG